MSSERHFQPLSALRLFRSKSTDTDRPRSRSSALGYEEEYTARRSNRVLTQVKHDNDTWVEHFSVFEMHSNNGHGGSSRRRKDRGGDGGSGTMMVRHYFQSCATGARVWDEPPTGATRIRYATAMARQMAEAQLEQANNANQAASALVTSSSSAWGRRRKGSRRRRKNRTGDEDEDDDRSMTQDGDMGIVMADTMGHLRDPSMQAAIAESLDTQPAWYGPDRDRGHTLSSPDAKLKEDLNVAKALSLSITVQ